MNQVPISHSIWSTQPQGCTTNSNVDADLVSVVACVEIWENADIGLAGHFTVSLDFLLGNFRVYSCIILYWTCIPLQACRLSGSKVAACIISS